MFSMKMQKIMQDNAAVYRTQSTLGTYLRTHTYQMNRHSYWMKLTHFATIDQKLAYFE